jgi:myo-inositol-hexaphosphate 3-phosphohydrolase
MLYPPAFGLTVPTPGANVGYATYNGDGTGRDVVTFRVGNAIVLENFSSPITYTVNADCTGTKSVMGGPKFGIFVAADGSEVATIGTDPGNYVASITHRVSGR